MLINEKKNNCGTKVSNSALIIKKGPEIFHFQEKLPFPSYIFFEESYAITLK